ncbi:MAG: hypothetical protein ACK5M7_19750 [Draconibacterium sp.]
MKGKARLIYKTNNTLLAQFLPVYFYGLPNEKIVVLFTREKAGNPTRKSLEWVVASHPDFRYDYETDAIVDKENRMCDFDDFMEYIDKQEQHVQPLQVFGEFYSLLDAEQFYNSGAHKMLYNLEPARAVMNY